MGIGRLLVVVLLVWAAFRLYRACRAPRAGGNAPGRGKLVRCARCGVYLPLAETRRNHDDAPVCAHHGVDD